MKRFHGSGKKIEIGDSLRTPTGVSCMDVVSGGVVYVTDTPEACHRYGTVYVVDCIDEVSYAEQRRRQGLPAKKGRYTRGVYVCLPENTRVQGETK